MRRRAPALRRRRRLDGTPQAAIWAIALASTSWAPYVGGGRGWRVSPGHFAERHGLIVIIALGESIVAIGAGPRRAARRRRRRRRAPRPRRRGRLWWAYFDVVAIVAERRLHGAEGSAQLAIARDSYSYLHLPMVAGIVLFAVGVKKTLGHVGDPLETVPAVALCGGAALYLLAHVLFRLRNVHSLNRRRLVVGAVLLALFPPRSRCPPSPRLRSSPLSVSA